MSAYRKIEKKFGDRIIENLQRLIHNELTYTLSAVIKGLETVETNEDADGNPLWKHRDFTDEDFSPPFESYKEFLKGEMRRGLSISPLSRRLMIALQESLDDARSEDPMTKLKLNIQELTHEHVCALIEADGEVPVEPSRELLSYLELHRDLVLRSYLNSCAQFSHLFSANAISRALGDLLDISKK